MNIVVQKYGGTSVGNINKIKGVARGIIREKNKGKDIVVVVSAMGNTTDKLINMAREISKTPSLRELDVLLSTGEQQTIALLAMTLKEYGYDAISLTGYQVGIETTGIHTKNKISDINMDKVKKHLNNGKIVIIAGFQGVNKNGDITTLGRGGSDTTAVALASKLSCLCEIYTDVDGVYKIDPRLYTEAKRINYIDYNQMIEMADLGAKVLEKRAVILAKKYNVPIYVGLSCKEKKGTYIGGRNMLEENNITGLVVSDDIFTISIDNIPNNSKEVSKILRLFKKYTLEINIINKVLSKNNTLSMTFLCKSDNRILINRIEDELRHRFKGLKINKNCDDVRISLVGTGINTQLDTLDKVFEIFINNKVEFNQITNSEVSLSYIIKKEYKFKIVNEFVKTFNL
ncbi:aspartate kinase [Dethiothermospora halolimnae]|uniref:aspartate kinase n=1 Tax=Dethiothermospora halolimnae TaxID=3114390 RepID=UPI003CCB828D